MKHPALVFMHGGSRRQMLLGWHYMDYYNNAYAMNQYLASQGYVVLSINYRSGIGYGLNFREAINYGASGASEFNDVEGAGLYLRTRADVDPARIGLWGGSYGGYLTALGLARASNLFAAGVDFHGVHDWSVRGDGGRDPGRSGRGAHGVRIVAHGERADLALAGAADPRRRRSQRQLQRDDRDGECAPPAGRVLRAADPARRDPRFLRHASWLRGYHAAVDFFTGSCNARGGTPPASEDELGSELDHPRRDALDSAADHAECGRTAVQVHGGRIRD